MLIYFVPYVLASASINALKNKMNEETGVSAYKLNAFNVDEQHYSSRVPTNPRMYVNWGSTNTGFLPNVVNRPNVLRLNVIDVRNVTNKLSFFNSYGSISIDEDGSIFQLTNDIIFPRLVPFTTIADRARAAYNAGNIIVERQNLSGHSGAGIVIHDPSNPAIPFNRNTKLWTLYKKKKEEYRVHFSRTTGGIFHIQKKLRKADSQAPDGLDSRLHYLVRNLQTGWVYSAHTDVASVPEDVIVQANKFISLTSLDFGAIDIIYNAREQAAYILEVNTAPGLSGTTLDKYSEMLISTFRNHNWASNRSTFLRAAR